MQIYHINLYITSSVVLCLPMNCSILLHENTCTTFKAYAQKVLKLLRLRTICWDVSDYFLLKGESDKVLSIVWLMTTYPFISLMRSCHPLRDLYLPLFRIQGKPLSGRGCSRVAQSSFSRVPEDCKKRLAVYPSPPAGMSLTKLSMGGNN
jgi:hypothetical protein